MPFEQNPGPGEGGGEALVADGQWLITSQWTQLSVSFLLTIERAGKIIVVVEFFFFSYLVSFKAELFFCCCSFVSLGLVFLHHCYKFPELCWVVFVVVVAAANINSSFEMLKKPRYFWFSFNRSVEFEQLPSTISSILILYYCSISGSNSSYLVGLTPSFGYIRAILKYVFRSRVFLVLMLFEPTKASTWKTWRTVL